MDAQPPPNPWQSPDGRISDARPLSIGTAPAVAKWQLVYVWCMVLLYIAVAAVGAALFAFGDQLAAGDPEIGETEMQVMGVIYGVLGVALTIVFGVGLIWRRGTGGWIYNIVLIAIGLTSCCTWPATIPLLIYWIKDKDHIVG